MGQLNLVSETIFSNTGLSNFLPSSGEELNEVLSADLLVCQSELT